MWGLTFTLRFYFAKALCHFFRGANSIFWILKSANRHEEKTCFYHQECGLARSNPLNFLLLIYLHCLGLSLAKKRWLSIIGVDQYLFFNFESRQA